MFYSIALLLCIFAYLTGSIPTGYLIVKFKANIDVRTIGSGSTGATNVKRVLGKKWFFITLILDVIKGAIPVIIAKIITNSSLLNDKYGLIAVLCSIFVILGHSKSVFLKFQGGKSVASGVGTILALNPLVGLTVGIIWGIITYATKYVSVGSIIALCLSPFLMHYFKNPLFYVVYCSVAAIYIVYLHRQNILRLIKGEENKVR